MINAMLSQYIKTVCVLPLSTLTCCEPKVPTTAPAMVTPILIDNCIIIDSRLLPLLLRGCPGDLSASEVFMEEKRVELTIPCKTGRTAKRKYQPSRAVNNRGDQRQAQRGRHQYPTITKAIHYCTTIRFIPRCHREDHIIGIKRRAARARMICRKTGVS